MKSRLVRIKTVSVNHFKFHTVYYNYKDIDINIELPPKSKLKDADIVATCLRALINARNYGKKISLISRLRINCLDDNIKSQLVKSKLYNNEHYNPPLKDVYVLYRRYYNKKLREEVARIKNDNWKAMLNLFGNILIDDVTMEVIDNVVNNLGKTETYSKFCKTELKTFFHWCQMQSYLKETPFSGVIVRRRTPKSEHIDMSIEDCMKVFNLVESNEIKLAILLFRFEGLSRQDLFGITWDSFEEDRIFIEGTTGLVKNRKSRIIPLFPEVRDFINTLDRDIPLFYHYKISSVITLVNNIFKEFNSSFTRATTNMRYARGLEIREMFGEHAENKWLSKKNINGSLLRQEVPEELLKQASNTYTK